MVSTPAMKERKALGPKTNKLFSHAQSDKAIYERKPKNTRKVIMIEDETNKAQNNF